MQVSLSLFIAEGDMRLYRIVYLPLESLDLLELIPSVKFFTICFILYPTLSALYPTSLYLYSASLFS